MESLKDKSAIIKIGKSALIMKLVVSSGVRELGLSLKEQEKEEDGQLSSVRNPSLGFS